MIIIRTSLIIDRVKARVKRFFDYLVFLLVFIDTIPRFLHSILKKFKKGA